MTICRGLLAPALLVPMLGLAIPANAQQSPGVFQCSASAVAPQIRAEGETELVADIVLNCTGGTPTVAGTNVPTADITVSLNTVVASRLMGNNPGSEALLLVDEPDPGELNVCPSLDGCTYDGGAGGPLPNVFQGTVWGNTVTFYGVPINPAGDGRIFRITNVRANANAAAGASGAGQITASISIGGSTPMPVTNPNQTVAFVQAGLNFELRDSTNDHALKASEIDLRQCVSIAKTNLHALLRFREGFANSFKQRFVTDGSVANPSIDPNLQDNTGSVYTSESGYYAGGDTLTNAGLASFGTRLKAVFNNIPARVNVYVSVTNVSSSSGALAVLIDSEAAAFKALAKTDTVSYPVIGATDVVQLTVVKGSATAVWEVTAAQPLSTDDYLFTVSFEAASDVGKNLPAPTSITATVTGSFAPAPPAFSANDGANAQEDKFPIPRFASASAASNILRIGICRTTLLFPYVSNAALLGFDTSIAITNTTLRPTQVGTPPQSGSCTLKYYGSTQNGTGPATPAPADQTSQPIAAGQQLVLTLFTGSNDSAIQPTTGFQGYIIATCGFENAHGIALLSDLGMQKFAAPLPVLVIPEDSASALRPARSESLDQ